MGVNIIDLEKPIPGGMKLGTQTGSVTNWLMSGTTAQPKVGDGATLLWWTDREAATIIEASERMVLVQVDKAIRTDNHGMSESQSYRFERDPDGKTYVFTLRHNGRWVARGERAGNGLGIIFGHRSAYYDYSF